MKRKNYKICVITFPSIWQTNEIFLRSLETILAHLTDKRVIISGNLSKEVFCTDTCFLDVGVPIEYNKYKFKKIILIYTILSIQIKISLSLLKVIKDTDVIIFYLANLYQIPLILSRLMGKTTVLLQTNSLSQMDCFPSKSCSFLSKKFSPALIKSSCHLADYIVPESEGLAHEYAQFKSKVILSGARFIDLTIFHAKTPIDERKNIVGYMGRLSPEKGIMNFVEAIPLILKANSDVEFLICGEGPLFGEIDEKIKNYPLNKVRLCRWIGRDEIVNYLNEIKLLVMPSYTEGLPTTILEAMACGTLVLATPVGAITDIVIDHKTGFILKDNSPLSITKTILYILNCQYVSRVSANARNLIERNYTLDAAINRFSRILEIATKKNDINSYWTGY